MDVEVKNSKFSDENSGGKKSSKVNKITKLGKNKVSALQRAKIIIKKQRKSRANSQSKITSRKKRITISNGKANTKKTCLYRRKKKIKLTTNKKKEKESIPLKGTCKEPCKENNFKDFDSLSKKNSEMIEEFIQEQLVLKKKIKEKFDSLKITYKEKSYKEIQKEAAEEVKKIMEIMEKNQKKKKEEKKEVMVIEKMEKSTQTKKKGINRTKKTKKKPNEVKERILTLIRNASLKNPLYLEENTRISKETNHQFLLKRSTIKNHMKGKFMGKLNNYHEKKVGESQMIIYRKKYFVLLLLILFFTLPFPPVFVRMKNYILKKSQNQKKKDKLQSNHKMKSFIVSYLCYFPFLVFSCVQFIVLVFTVAFLS